MLSINDLKTGITLIYKDQPHEVLEAKHLMLGRGGGMLQTKIKNLITGNVLSETFKGSDKFEEAEILYKKIKFIYFHRGKFIFLEIENPSKRFELDESVIGDSKYFLKANLEPEGVCFKDRIINIKLPPKVDLVVVEAPPGIRGDTAQGGTKPVTLETGLKVNVPLFIDEGEVVRVNTKTGGYVERVK